MKLFNALAIIIALVTAGDVSRAQTCNGEVVKFQETFGAGDRTSLPNGRTNYKYKNNGSLSDGDYTLLKTSQAKPEWHISADHTGDLNGRMMVTNASFAAGEFYRDTVYNVSSVSTYNIYFYAMNVNTVGTCSPNPILPKLQLVVESYNFDGSFTQIYTMTSAFLPQTASPAWVKISGQFYLPTQCTAVRYRIINNSTGGCGNDLAIDDITFSQCQPVLLPANGLTLKGKAVNNSTQLSWSTVSEINTDKFIIEKSSDDQKWKDIATVKAAGQSNMLKEYSFNDDALNVPVTFYRIVSVDGNGKSTYSNNIIIKSASPENAELSAFPNPFTSLLKVELNSGPDQHASLRIFDLNGKMVKSMPLALKNGENSISISALDKLNPGMYFLNVVNTAGAVLGKTKVLKW
jgi:hypothetical protein